ncbi:MAG TPA: SUF system Fe-S cluster assembly regulator [Candidatus Acidoferrales bacterium]|nr:SUF system Fe-S cluster assembly regulator [Candidatus Acidoferrales bacterium]
MFRLNKLTDYAIVVMTHIATSPQLPLHTARELAADTQLPLATVGKVLRGLLDHHLVTSHRGMKGGYALSRPAKEISLAQIIGAFEGPIGFTECNTTPGCCDLERSCTVRYNSNVIGKALQHALEGIRLSDLTKPMHESSSGNGSTVSITFGSGDTDEHHQHHSRPYQARI